jgi:hypothetical protein
MKSTKLLCAGFLLALVFFANKSIGQAKATGNCDGIITSDEALSAEDARYKALLRTDFPALERMFSDDLYYSHSDGALNTKRVFLDNLKKSPSKYVSFIRHSATVKTYGCTALISGEMTISTNQGAGKEPHGSYLRFTSVWIKRDKKLEFVHWQSTPLKEKEDKNEEKK